MIEDQARKIADELKAIRELLEMLLKLLTEYNS